MPEQRCLICGMQINERNYSFNKAAILKTNSTSVLTSCPFCGVSSKYFSQGEETWITEEFILDEVSAKIIDHAMKLEVFNSDFYKKAAGLAENSDIKLMFEALSKIELMHAKIHQKLGGFTELPVLQSLDYTKYKGDDVLLELARKREEHAVAYYTKYAGDICNNRIISVFEALQNVEKEHIVLVQK